MQHLLSITALLLTLAAQQALAQAGTEANGRLAAAPPRASQPEATQAQSANPAGLCAIEGRVLNAATGEPIKKARLTLRRTDATSIPGSPPTSYTTSADETGGFAMKDIEAGKYRLSADRTGFVSAEYGEHGASRQGSLLALSPGQHMQSLVFKLIQHAIVTGRVVDTDGEPLVYAQMQTLRYAYNNGKKQLVPFGYASTNDLGEYRIFGLAPGRYFLSATPRQEYQFGPTLDRTAAPQPEEAFVANYYPGTTDLASASTIDVTPGAQIQGMDFRLSKARTVRVHGHVNNLSGSGRTAARITVTSRQQPSGFRRDIGASLSGDFEMHGLAPGEYLLAAIVFDNNKTFVGRQVLNVGDSDLENVNVTIYPPMEIAGQVRVEGLANGAAHPDLSSVRIMLRPRGDALYSGSVGNGRVTDEKGSFSITNASSGSYDISVFGLPDGYYVKSIAMGHEEVLDSGVNLSNGAAGPISIVLRPGAGQIDGSVMNGEEKPAPGATVVLIPKDEKRRERAYKNTTTDQYGHFTLRNIDPGDYKLFAWEDVETGAYMDPDFVKPVESQGTSITIQENSHENQQLKWIPAEGTQPRESSPVAAGR